MKKRILLSALSLATALILTSCSGAVSGGDSASADAVSGDAVSAGSTSGDSDASELQTGMVTDEAASGTASLTIAFADASGFEPVMIAMEQGLIEEAYAAQTGGSLIIAWTQVSSSEDAAALLTSGGADIGFLDAESAGSVTAAEGEWAVFTDVSEDPSVVGVAPETRHEQSPALYQAVCDGIAAAKEQIAE